MVTILAIVVGFSLRVLAILFNWSMPKFIYDKELQMKPQRMQLSRKAGFNLQAASQALNGLPAKRVTRPGKWGNPFTIDETAARYRARRGCRAGQGGRALRPMASRHARPASFRPASRRAAPRSVAELAGHNLACWCRPGTPCHADVLIELANA